MSVVYGRVPYTQSYIEHTHTTDKAKSSTYNLGSQVRPSRKGDTSCSTAPETWGHSKGTKVVVITTEVWVAY